MTLFWMTNLNHCQTGLDSTTSSNRVEPTLQIKPSQNSLTTAATLLAQHMHVEHQGLPKIKL